MDEVLAADGAEFALREEPRQGHRAGFLAHHAFDTQPVGDIAAFQVDDEQAAAGLRAAFCQLLVQRQAAEGRIEFQIEQ